MRIGIAIFAVVVCFTSGVVLSICLDEKGQSLQGAKNPASEGSTVPDGPDSDDIRMPQEPRSPKGNSVLYFRTLLAVRHW